MPLNPTTAKCVTIIVLDVHCFLGTVLKAMDVRPIFFTTMLAVLAFLPVPMVPLLILLPNSVKTALINVLFVMEQSLLNALNVKA